jgi:anti-sigma factor RsiW
MKPSCEHYLELLSSSLDGELTAAEARELEAHLAGCAECRQVFEELRAGDQGLRLAARDAENPAREDAALARTLARLRDEPAPEWAAASRRRSRLRWPVVLRWSVGLAATTAAVLLAMRLGPNPVAPIRTRTIAPSHETQGSAAASSPAAPESPEGRAKGASPRTGTGIAEGDDRSFAATEMKAKEAPAPTVESIGSKGNELLVAKDTETQVPQPAKQEETVATTDQGAVTEDGRSTSDERRVQDSFANVPTDETSGKTAQDGEPGETRVDAARQAPVVQEVPPGREAPRAKEAPGAREAPPAQETPAARSTAPTRVTPQSGKLESRAGQNLAGGGAHREQAARPMELEALPTPPWYMNVADEDTTRVDPTMRSRIDLAEAELVAHGVALSAGERARRFRAIGDLWEWFGRSTADAFTSSRALECYRRAAESDPEAAALDSTRVQRARSAAAAAGPRKIQPAYR